MPSIVSDVSAAHSVATSQRLQASTSGQGTDSQPFAALLDAAASAPAATYVVASSPQPTQSAATPPSAPEPAGGSSPQGSDDVHSVNASAPTNVGAALTANRGANAAPHTKSDARSPWRANGVTTAASNVPAGANGTGKPTDGKQARSRPWEPSVGSNATDAPAATPTNSGSDPSGEANNGPASPGSAPADGMDSARMAMVAAATTAAGVTAASAPSSPQLSGSKRASDRTSGDTGDIGSSTAGSDAPASASPSPPVAAAIAVSAAPAPPASTAAPVTAAAIGEGTKARIKTNELPASGEQTAAPHDAANDALGNKTRSATSVDGGADLRSGAAGDTAAPASQDSSAQPTPTQAADDVAAGASAGGPASAPTEHANALAAGLTGISASNASGSPDTQSGSDPVPKGVDGLPNFGFSAAAAGATSSTAPAASALAGASAAAVPIAGLAVAIAARAQAGSNQFEIRLDPPELGRIDVRLGIDRDGQVTSHVTADRADTLALLQNQQPQLERALEQAGLKTADNGLQFTLRDQSFAGGNYGGNAQSNTAHIVVPDADLPAVAATQIYSRGGSGSGIDIRV